jgi:transcription initiation factor TFIID TATA-box-binding protein
MTKLKIVNVVATTNIKQPIDIMEAGRFKDFLHDSEIYGGRVTYYKNENMIGRVTIFPSGKMISVGSRSIEDTKNQFSQALDALVENKLAKPTPIENIRIENIVATVDLGEPVDLEEISARLRAIYEPEQFPGAILHLEEPKATVLIFSSGKCVMTGTKSESSLNQAMRKLSQILSASARLRSGKG